MASLKVPLDRKDNQIGQFRNGEFEAMSNFAVHVEGTVEEPLTGVVFEAAFHDIMRTLRFFVPFTDIGNANEFKKHLLFQYREDR